MGAAFAYSVLNYITDRRAFSGYSKWRLLGNILPVIVAMKLTKFAVKGKVIPTK